MYNTFSVSKNTFFVSTLGGGEEMIGLYMFYLIIRDCKIIYLEYKTVLKIC